MISGLDKIPDFVDDNEIYYKKRNTDENITKSLRDFHNKYVKSLLIRTTSMPDNILIDMSVGRGGDIYKWIESRLKFVLESTIQKIISIIKETVFARDISKLK